MATRALLAELATAYAAQHGVQLLITSVGGVDAAKRIQAGEAFDVVVLASDAVDRLINSGQVVAGSRVDLVHSGVAVAVPAGAALPDISSEDAVRNAVLSARKIGYSTGPSGVQLAKLFARWGIADAVQARTVQAPPGVPVGALVARGEVDLGFQQLSELLHVPDIKIVGPLPPAIQINTTFSAGLCVVSSQAAVVRALLVFLTSPASAAAKTKQGMDPA